MQITSRRLSRVVALAAAAATVVTLGACTAAPAEDQVLTISSGYLKGNPLGDVFLAQMELFTEQTGIEVDVKDLPDGDAQTIVEADYLAGEESDILLVNLVGDNQAWVVDGLTVDAGPLIEEWGVGDRISESAVSAWTNSEGQVSGFAYSSFVWPIWYNQALFDQAGVDIPTTYDDLVTASAALRAAGIQPFAIAGGDWPGNNFLTWIAQQYLDAEGSAALAANGDFCSPDALKGLELLSEMTRNGVFIDDAAGYTADTMTSAYFNGDAAMMPSGSWAISGAPDDIIENTVLGGFPVPDGGAYDKPTMFFGDTSTGIWISRNGQENLDAARKFVEFMYQPETVNAFIDGADMIPSAVVSSDSPVPANPLLAKAVTLRDANDGIVLWDTLTPVGVDSQAVANSIYGGTPASEACASLETIWADAKG